MVVASQFYVRMRVLQQQCVYRSCLPALAETLAGDRRCSPETLN